MKSEPFLNKHVFNSNSVTFIFNCVQYASYAYMARRTNQRIADIDRARLLAAHTNGEDFLGTARLLGIKRSTAYSVIRSGRPVKLPTGGARQTHIKVDEEICNLVAELLERNALLTLLEINHHIRTRFPHKREFSKSTLSNKLDGLLFTTKLCTRCTGGKRSARCHTGKNWVGNMVVFTGCRQHQQNLCGWNGI